MHPVEAYLREVGRGHRSGFAVAETSHYTALKNLLDAVGQDLKPRVACLVNPANQGAGIPDAGFFTQDQFPRRGELEFTASSNPARGAAEVKGLDADVDHVAQSDQVARYLDHYGQVLVTNLKDFLLVGLVNGVPTPLERFSLAESRDDFLSKSAQPRKMANDLGERLLDYLKRVLLRPAPIRDPQDLAWLMAAYAREALARVEASQLPALQSIRNAMEEALGIRFHGPEGEHFFRSTLVQTLFYGLFSAWVAWARKENPENAYARFKWREASWSLSVPMIDSLFAQINNPATLRPLGLEEVLDWTGGALNRVDRSAFFNRFVEERAVQYFYEPFLQAYDPGLRKELGVWYTPPEIVTYMVERVDQVLREELELPDGLADPRVMILDPCCGTGAYLVEVLDRIARTLQDKGDDALMGQELKRAAMDRVFGFELLPAPYVVAHLQMGLVLDRWSAPLKIDPKQPGATERAAVYLTNALTGWKPAEGPKQHLFLPELERERDAAEQVKQEAPILVVLGNPPYNAFAGVSPAEEQGQVDVYKEGLSQEWGVRKYNLDDLYVRFFRLAERRIAEMTGRGVVCYISNFSYLRDSSFVVMRKRLLNGFDRLWFDCMNGDSRQTGKITPEGEPDPSVFSTEYSPVGIRVGTVVGLLAKHGAENAEAPQVFFRHFWGVSKRQELLESLKTEEFDKQYEQAEPKPHNRYTFRPMREAEEYREWPKLTELCSQPPSNGLMEKRGGALMAIDRPVLEERMKQYFDSDVSWEELKRLDTGLTRDAARFEARKARPKVLNQEQYQPSRIRPYAVRPFDVRWCYFSPVRPLWNEPRPALWAQCWQGNAFLLSRVATTKSPEGVPFFFSRELFDDHLLTPDASGFPLRLKTTNHTYGNNHHDQHALGAGSDKETITANLAEPVRAYLAGLGFAEPDADPEQADLVWMHALAVGCSPAYLEEHADAIQSDWPRIPLPASRERLETSAALGRRLAELMDTMTPLDGVTAGSLPPAFRAIGAPAPATGQQLNPDAGHLDLTAGWGYSGGNGVTMPGRGKITQREYTDQEREAVQQTAAELGLDPEEAFHRLGVSTCDVWLNDHAFWRNIPANVWEFYIGGYQVLKKWLAYREKKILGRGLTTDETRHVMHAARRLAAIRLLEPALDANYAAIKLDVLPWPEA